MARPLDDKAYILKEEGTLNATPERVSDSKFREGEFFDPRDVVQVKYEMLRRVSMEDLSVTEAAREYGVTRPTYYQAKINYETKGIAGLVPKRRGPQGPHKLQGEVLIFLKQHFTPGQPIRARKLAKLVQKEFNLKIHPRTIERGLRGKKTQG
jgi:transposase